MWFSSYYSLIFHLYENLHFLTIKYRLDKIAEAGLPIWITELSIEDENVQNKANALEDVYTLYFSLPSIEGILLWGFADTHLFAHSAALANGQNVTVICGLYYISNSLKYQNAHYSHIKTV